MREQAPVVLNGKRAVDVVGWLNGAENGRAANGHLANGHHAWDSAVAVLADAGCNGAAAQPPLDLPEAFPEQPRSGAPFLSRRSSSAVSEAASLGRHSNGGAAEPLCAPGGALKQQQQQRQPGRPASLHTRSASQHSQPGTPCSSVGTPRTTRSVGRSKLGLPNGCAAEQPACCAAEAQPCSRGCASGDEAIEAAVLSNSSHATPRGPQYNHSFSFQAPPSPQDSSPVEVVASFPVELSPEQRQLEGEAELIHSDEDADNDEPDSPHGCPMPLPPFMPPPMYPCYGPQFYAQHPQGVDMQQGVPPPYMMAHYYGMMSQPWFSAMVGAHPAHHPLAHGGAPVRVGKGAGSPGTEGEHYPRGQHFHHHHLHAMVGHGHYGYGPAVVEADAAHGPWMGKGHGRARGRGPTSTSSHTSVLAFGASRGGRGETTPTTTSGYLSSSNTSAREAPSRSTAGSASVSTPRSSSGILQPLPQPLVVEEREGELDSEALDRFKADDKEGRGAWQLQDIRGHVYPFCRDQAGSRFVQQLLDGAGPGGTAPLALQLLEELEEAQLLALMVDVFGNYVVQRLMQLGGQPVHERVAAVMQGRVLPLSLQMYGCRMVQKALEVFGDEGKLAICKELQGHTQQCVRDQNGNHVIQKVIEWVQPSDPAWSIIESIVAKSTQLSCHAFGCRLVQRVLEHCTIAQLKERAITEVLANALQLSHDQFGNYVVQHLVTRGAPSSRLAVVTKVAPQVMALAQHKFASNVVEACFRHSDGQQRDLLLKYMTGEANTRPGAMLNLMKDQYGNYVVQRALEVCDDHQRERLLALIKPNLANLRKFTYGKHIVARVEALLLAEQQQLQAAVAPAGPGSYAAIAARSGGSSSAAGPPPGLPPRPAPPAAAAAAPAGSPQPEGQRRRGGGANGSPAGQRRRQQQQQQPSPAES